MIEYPCPHCGERLSIPDEHSGESRTCDHCSGNIVVPKPFEKDALPATPKRRPLVSSLPPAEQHEHQSLRQAMRRKADVDGYKLKLQGRCLLLLLLILLISGGINWALTKGWSRSLDETFDNLIVGLIASAAGMVAYVSLGLLFFGLVLFLSKVSDYPVNYFLREIKKDIDDWLDRRTRGEDKED